MPVEGLRTRSREIETRKGLQSINSGSIPSNHSSKRTSDLTASSGGQLGRMNSSKIYINSFKHIEQIQLEGNFKLKKVFSSRSQIPLDASADELHDIISHDKSIKIEQIPNKLDFNQEVKYTN